MLKIEKIKKRREITANRVKKFNKGCRPILNIFRSNKNIYAQVIALDGTVLASYSSKKAEAISEFKGKDGKEIASIVGERLAAEAIKNNVKEVVFNKGPYLYSGRVQALAEGARKGGLVF